MDFPYHSIHRAPDPSFFRAEISVPSGTWTDSNGDGDADPGETIVYSLEITNTGTVSMNNMTMASDTVGVENIECPPLPEGGLAPGSKVSCAATHEVRVMSRYVQSKRARSSIRAFQGYNYPSKAFEETALLVSARNCLVRLCHRVIAMGPWVGLNSAVLVSPTVLSLGFLWQLTQDDIDTGEVITLKTVRMENPMGAEANATSSHTDTSMTRRPGINLGDLDDLASDALLRHRFCVSYIYLLYCQHISFPLLHFSARFSRAALPVLNKYADLRRWPAYLYPVPPNSLIAASQQYIFCHHLTCLKTPASNLCGSHGCSLG